MAIKYEEDVTSSKIGGTAVYDVNQSAQTFVASNNYSIEYVKLDVWKTNSPGNVTIEIQSTTGSPAEPDGNVLATVTVNGNLWPTDPSEWLTFTFDSPAVLRIGVTYAIVMKAPGASNPNWARWWYGVSTEKRCSSTDGGSSWSTGVTGEHLFETWGGTVGLAPPSTGERITYKRLVAAANSKIFYEDL